MILKAQSVERDNSQNEQKVMTLQEIKSIEIKKNKSLCNQSLERTDLEIRGLEEKKLTYDCMLAEAQAKLLEEEQDMRNEIQKLEAEIKVVKTEAKQMEHALAQKERSQQFQSVNQFFGTEVPSEYLPKIKECFKDLKHSKDYKLQLFQDKKRLN